MRYGELAARLIQMTTRAPANRGPLHQAVLLLADDLHSAPERSLHSDGADCRSDANDAAYDLPGPSEYLLRLNLKHPCGSAL